MVKLKKTLLCVEICFLSSAKIKFKVIRLTIEDIDIDK